MADKKKADQQASPKKTPLHDTSGDAQRARLLSHLREHGSINTFEAIRLLNVLRPGARIFELRARGYKIATHLGVLKDDQGRLHHRVATYYLGTNAPKVPA